MSHNKVDIGQLLLLTTRDFQQRMGAKLKQKGITGIGPRHSTALMHLAQCGESRLVDIAKASDIKPQSMMKIINELEALAYVERMPDPSDTRAKLIQFSKKGNRIIQQLSVAASEVWDEYAKLIGQKNLRITMDSLDQLMQMTNTHYQPTQENE